MKYSFAAAALLAVAGVANAQIPACATTCISDAVKSATSCGATDLACQCTSSNEQAIQAAATSCVLTACGDQALSVLSAAQAQCQAVLAGGSSSSAAAPTSSAAAPTTSAAAPATTSSAAGAPATSSAASSTLATSSAVTTPAAPSSTGSSNSTGTGNGTITSGLPPTPSGNSAAQMGASLGGAFVMAAVALIAF
ncbi:hypothetical protein F5884DRAFT_747110 [Xylogone sp. PMI_703]|nr:hypothetical protein F5884DRAFT_747110 [Xylogone sp. PMI_703]